MRKALFVLLVVLLYAIPANAQESGGRERRAYFFVAPGLITGYSEPLTLRLGGGTETVWPSGIGFGIDAGYLGIAEEFDGGIFTISPTVIYEFPVDGRLKPFVRGGITLMVGRGGGDGFWSVGGGADYWFKERMGLRVEVRDSFQANSRGTFLEFQFGLVFKY